MKQNFTWVLLGILTATTAGCGAIIGLDEDYKEGSAAAGAGADASGGGEGGSGSGGGSSGATQSGGSESSSSSSNSSGSVSVTCNSSDSGGSPGGMRSCVDLGHLCGPMQNEDCCSTVSMPGGNFNRDGNEAFPATVCGFSLDRFEVTVERFRKFVDAYPLSKPEAGKGANPNVKADKGWDPTFDSSLPPDQGLFKLNLSSCKNPDGSLTPASTWLDTPDANERLPINCVNWYEAQAFCIWDGGRLPTELEWSYAAVGGDEARLYPWGPTAPTSTSAAFNCTGDSQAGCMLADILPVGSRPAGNGVWNQADLAGNVSEWVLDTWAATYPPTCVNCAMLTPGLLRLSRGGSWYDTKDNLRNTSRFPSTKGDRAAKIGFRCARD
jgi:sulfatase modifying factor 1